MKTNSAAAAINFVVLGLLGTDGQQLAAAATRKRAAHSSMQFISSWGKARQNKCRSRRIRASQRTPANPQIVHLPWIKILTL